MSDETAVYQRLVAAASVTDLLPVNGNGDKTIYPIVRTQDDPVPAVVLSPISSVPFSVMHGRPPLDRRRVQVAVYAEDYDQARALNIAIRDEMERADFSHQIGESFHDFESDTKLFRISSDYSLIQGR